MRTSEKLLSARFLVILTQMLCLLSLPSWAADVTVNVDASSFIRAIPETMYGTNTMTWDGKQNGGNDNFNNLMAASGRRYIRWPGGSWGNSYLWSDMEGPNYTQTWKVNYKEVIDV
jgi:alpha-L-arabinofuranosidase